jgi:CRISPR system Cascade subunit CasE
MYLSRISLNAIDRKILNLLKDPYHLHAGIMTAFPEARKRDDRNESSGVLFRREPTERSTIIVHVLVQSRDEPDWAELTERYVQSLEIKSRQIEPLFENGQTLPFRLRANPVVTREGKRRCLVGEASHRNWLEKKGSTSGFLVTPESFRVIDEGFTKGEKVKDNRKFELSFRTVLYQGHLQVITAELFTEKAVQTGVGPCKGFGCGLLSVPYNRTAL